MVAGKERKFIYKTNNMGHEQLMDKYNRLRSRSETAEQFFMKDERDASKFVS